MEYYQIFGRATCPYCAKAWELLNLKELPHMFCEMEDSPELISYYKEKYNMKTVPIVIKRKDTDAELIGGCSDLIKYLEEFDKVTTE